MGEAIRRTEVITTLILIVCLSKKIHQDIDKHAWVGGQLVHENTVQRESHWDNDHRECSRSK